MYTMPVRMTLETIASHPAVHSLTGQIEMCPTTGRHHLQFVIHVNRASMTAVKSIIGDDSVHVEPVSRGWANAIAYCSKEETRIDGPWTYNKEGMYISPAGVLVKSGRTAIATAAGAAKKEKLTELVVEACKEGKGARSVMEKYPQAYLLYGAKLGALAEMYAPGREFMPEKKVFMLWGPPRTGKTRRAMYELSKLDGGYDDVQLTQGGFAIGYTGKKGVLIDEPRREVLDVTLCLRLFDHYSCKVNVKGSETMWKPDLIFVTSNLSLDELFNTTRSEQLEALHARVTEIHMTSAWIPPEESEPETVEPSDVIDVPDAQPIFPALLDVPHIDDEMTQEIMPASGDMFARCD